MTLSRKYDESRLNIAHRIMRRTGKLYNLTLISSVLTVVASILLVFWNDKSSWIHLWLDIVPQGFGMASVITTTLIVSRAASRQSYRAAR